MYSYSPAMGVGFGFIPERKYKINIELADPGVHINMNYSACMFPLKETACM